MPGINPAPIPCILCGAGFPPDNTDDFEGSTATTFISDLNSFNFFPIPDKVPPVPTPATNASIFGRSCIISSAVDS